MFFKDQNGESIDHHGMPMRSGRYPWGSGKDPYQHTNDFLSRINDLKKQGMSEVDIAKSMGLSTTQLRTQKSLARNERRELDVDTAKGLREKGYSLTEIANKMGYKNESSIRSLLNSNSEERMKQTQKAVDFLRNQIDTKGMIDVGSGVERELGISREKMNQALYTLELEGYKVYGGGVPQITNPGKQINVKVIGPPGTEHKDIYNFQNVKSITEYHSQDDGQTFNKYEYPKSLDGKRVLVRYAEDGGIQKDGLIELRRGKEDISLGESSYAQVRILVDDKKYMKGMAVYSDDIPKGYDVVFNTNKGKDIPKDKVFKDITNDPNNPFGSTIGAAGQRWYTDANGKKQLSTINKRADEGDWDNWKDVLPSQFLAKQNMSLINKQLDLELSKRKLEFDEINNLTNPTVKKKLLETFADGCDSTAVHLSAAALPRQKYQVILPVETLKNNEIYAPNYKNGETVALVRYPHGGTFEIPVLTVNNKHQDSIKRIGSKAKDAVGINANVASILSGADYDGDTVMVLPTGKTKIKSSPPLEGLKNFDPKLEYTAGPDGKYIKTTAQTEKKMGIASNLITDMTLKGATSAEIERAVKYSMVVIDSQKHKLDDVRCYNDNGIKSLQQKYQGRVDETGKYKQGASTLISSAKSEVRVPKTQGSGVIDPETGKVTYKVNESTYLNKKGEVVTRTQNTTRMANTDDARTLSSGTPQEEAYAKYANNMKDLANTARKTMVNTNNLVYSPSANKVYSTEVASLKAKTNVALSNTPKERAAQLTANSNFKLIKESNPDLTPIEAKKIKQQQLDAARVAVGASKQKIEVTPKEWEAIQAGAISNNSLVTILNNADMSIIRSYATPKATTTINTAQANRIKTMYNSGYTRSEIAESLGLSTSAINNTLKGE